MNQELLNKIEKLLAKAESSNFEAEAQAFLNKAQKLMAENNISAADLETNSKDKEEKIEQEDILKDRATSTRNVNLANIIAKNFKCTLFLRKDTLVFLGMESDVKIAKMTFQAIHTFMERRRRQIYKAAQKEGLPTKGIREDYTQGFLKGLEEAFKKNVEEFALIVITPEAVVKEHKSLTGGKVRHARGTQSSGNAETFNKGYQDGKGYGKQVEG